MRFQLCAACRHRHPRPPTTNQKAPARATDVLSTKGRASDTDLGSKHPKGKILDALTSSRPAHGNKNRRQSSWSLESRWGSPRPGKRLEIISWCTAGAQKTENSHFLMWCSVNQHNPLVSSTVLGSKCESMSNQHLFPSIQVSLFILNILQFL